MSTVPAWDEPLVRYDGTGTTSRRWLIADERGSIVAETNASGAAVQVNTYGAYGEPGNANTGRFGYTGQVFLGEVGLYHYKARAYNPEIGRFLQTDPIGVAGGMNLYAYVGGDPINNTDSMGLACDDADTCPVKVVGQRLGWRFKQYNMWLEQFFRSARAAAFGGVGQSGQAGATDGCVGANAAETDAISEAVEQIKRYSDMQTSNNPFGNNNPEFSQFQIVISRNRLTGEYGLGPEVNHRITLNYYPETGLVGQRTDAETDWNLSGFFSDPTTLVVGPYSELPVSHVETRSRFTRSPQRISMGALARGWKLPRSMNGYGVERVLLVGSDGKCQQI